MEIVEVSPSEYDNVIGNDIPIYSRSCFLELNKHKVDQIHYIIGKDKKNRIALAIGEKSGEWMAPFSAPFSNIVLLRKDTSIEYIWQFVQALIDHVKNHSGRMINFYMPADVYGFADNSRVLNALLGNGFYIKFQDVNYSFALNAFELDEYETLLQYNAKKNLKIANASALVFIKCETTEQKIEAYETIKINREYKGYPLRMTREQVLDTIKIVNHDIFLVKRENQTLAAAVVYRLTDKIAQVIYWGDIPGAGEYKTINFISYCLISYYKDLNFDLLDIGISTDEGNANFGLCSFKESLGCIPSSKFRVQIDL